MIKQINLIKKTIIAILLLSVLNVVNSKVINYEYITSK